ncbi:hypothetical protein BDV25DRAFT_150101 [Aspergillus avenaceus]|uniref:Secreted protein n=1 Tax=Aspergillus avenaceus TaxID=36643 RepID=A0A5N6U3M0_ASPAV|nr:hypothetical protein BDV25DRAFT_150101 [Aspergillus avenaceus]
MNEPWLSPYELGSTVRFFILGSWLLLTVAQAAQASGAYSRMMTSHKMIYKILIPYRSPPTQGEPVHYSIFLVCVADRSQRHGLSFSI